MNKLGTLAAAAVCAVLLPSTARASGYAIYETGAVALGRAGAATASIDDATAVFFNPARLVLLEGTHVSAGANVLQPFTSFAGVAPYPGFGVTEEMEAQQFFPPMVYATTRLGSRAAIGAGVFTPYGLGIEWKDPDRFTGRAVATKADLETVNGSVVVAYAINDRLSAAAGFDALLPRVKLQNRAFIPSVGGGGADLEVAKVTLESDLEPAYGWNAALSYRPTDKLMFGAYYRGTIVAKVEGDATFDYIPTGNPALDAQVRAQLVNQKVETVLRFPAIMSLGVAVRPTEAWTLEADLVGYQWSTFSDLPIYFQTTPARNRTIEEDYNDVVQIRVGAEHRLPAFTYRFGYYFDDAAAPTESVSALLPDAARHGIALGLGKRFGADGRWSVDAYQLSLLVEDRSTEGINRDGFDGEYASYVNLAGLSVAYHFGGGSSR
jgi:long-chain fatty acid transport protein